MAKQEATPERRVRWKMLALSLRRGPSPMPVFQVLGVVAVLALALALGARSWVNRSPPRPASYVDIVEVLGIVRARGDLTVRVHEFRLGETRAEQAVAAVTLWLRFTQEEHDPALKLQVETNSGRALAVVQGGSVSWAQQ